MRAIDANELKTAFPVCDNSKSVLIASVRATINHMPTIEPEHKKGKWIEHNPHKWGLGIVFECSECGEKIDCEPSNFCPNCGADMREPEDIPMEYFESGGR